MRRFLRNHDHFKISFLDMHILPYQMLSALCCCTSRHLEALCIVELGRARTLADLMSAQYSVDQQISVDQHSWVHIEEIMKKGSSCVCLYISYYTTDLFLWILKPNEKIISRRINVNDGLSSIETERSVDNFFVDETFRNFQIFPHEHCEDRSLFPSNVGCLTCTSYQEEGCIASRLVEVEEDETQHPEPLTLTQCYKMIIAPVANLLDEPEIIIVPDGILYKIPFAELKDENDRYLAETFRIRIVPNWFPCGPYKTKQQSSS